MAEDQKLTEGQLKAAIWYVKHRAILRKIGLGVFIALDAALIGTALFLIVRDIVALPLRRATETELSSGNSVSPSSPPLDLQLGGVEFLQSGAVTDVVARVRNPNAQWSVRFAYTLGLGGQSIRQENGFLLPGEERPFFHAFRASAGGAPVFNLENLEWRRVSPNPILDFSEFRTSHLNFELKDTQFLPSVLEGRGTVGRATFTLINKTAYSYAEPKFIVLLYRASRLVGIQSIVLQNFTAGQVRKAEVSWIDGIGAVSKIEVVPEIDVLAAEVYMRLE